jgi:hypothetical protein
MKRIPLTLGLAASFLASCGLILAIHHESKSLRGWGSDHYSHYMEAILFAHKGMRVYTEPPVKLCDRFVLAGAPS